MAPFKARLFWDNIDPAKKLYSRFGFLNINIVGALRDLSQSQNITPPREMMKRLQWVLRNNASGYPGQTMADQMHQALRTLQEVYALGCKEKENGRYVTDLKLEKEGFTEEVYRRVLRQVCEFLAWAYGQVVPDRIQEMYKSVELDDIAVPQEELDRLSRQDLFDYPDTRFPLIFILDNALYMERNLSKMKDGLDDLIDEIRHSNQLKDCIEMYVATCGGKVTEVVGFANLRRQEAILEQLQLLPYGPCKMAEAITQALDKLEERISVMQDEDTNVDFYCPWMIILSDGRFRDDMTAVRERLQDMIDRERIQVYVRGVSEAAILDNLRSIAGDVKVLDSVNGFFKDVFVSIKKSEYSVPGGERFHLENQEGFKLK